MTDFLTLIASQADVGVRFYLQIQGIPYVFLDGPTPTTKTGTTWTAPTSKTNSYGIKQYLLDVSDGIADPGSLLSRSSGDSQASQMTITLREDRAGFLHSLMAREDTTGNYANLAATFGYDDGFPPSVMTVDSTTGWPSSGWLYFGRETIKYGSTTSTTFGTLTRDVYSVGDADTIYRHNDSIPSAPRLVTDFPRVWHGRYVQLFAYLVGHDGTTYDSGFGGSYTAEIWRGVITGNPRPRSDWQRWDLRCDSIESIVDTEIGNEPITGALLRVPLDAYANSVGKNVLPQVANPHLNQWVFWIDGNTGYVSLRIKEWTNATDYVNQAAPTVYDYTGDDRLALNQPSTYSRSLLESQWAQVVTAQLVTDTSAPLTLSLHYAGGWYVYANSYGARVYEIEILWDAAGSVGPLVGFTGTTTIGPIGGSGAGAKPSSATASPQFAELAAYIPAVQEVPSIPFWYIDTGGTETDSPPSSGYARLGKDETAEIISYGSITDLGPTQALQGVYVLNDVERGLFGTTPREHIIRLSENGDADGDEVPLVFGAGLVGSPLDAMLQLAVSTGSGHHGTYDTLSDKIAVPLNPQHFDTAAIAALNDQLTSEQATIGLFLSKPTNLRELMSEWLRPLGLYLTARTNADGNYLITVDPLLPPLESEAQTAIGAQHLDIGDPAVYVDGLDRIINKIRIYPRWDVTEEDATDDVFTVNDFDSRSEFGRVQSIEWRLRGYQFGLSKGYQLATKWAHRIFARYGRPYDLFRLHMNRQGLALAPGDVVSVTLSGAPNASGTRGLTSRAAVVLRVEKRWHPAAGTGEATGADVTVVLEPYQRQSTYAPSARVASYNAGTPSITISATGYSPTGETDADHFDVGDVVLIYDEGDWSTVDQRTITAKNGATFTLNSTLTNATPVSATETVMVPAAYDASQASQQKHAYIGDNATPSTLGSGGDDAFRFV